MVVSLRILFSKVEDCTKVLVINALTRQTLSIGLAPLWENIFNKLCWLFSTYLTATVQATLLHSLGGLHFITLSLRFELD